MVTCFSCSEGQVGPGEGDVVGEAVFDRVAAERSAGDGREQRIAWGAGTFAEPGVQDRFGGRHQRRAPFFSAFADGVHVGAGGERDVLAGESGELGDPQTGLDGEGEHGVIAPSGPGVLVAGVQQRVDLGIGEVGEQVAFGSFGWDGEDTR